MTWLGKAEAAKQPRTNEAAEHQQDNVRRACADNEESGEGNDCIEEKMQKVVEDVWQRRWKNAAHQQIMKLLRTTPRSDADPLDRGNATGL